ncbi:MAG: peptidoglycan-associated lipoprotein Pal, partial [Desulfocapsa sp.]
VVEQSSPAPGNCHQGTKSGADGDDQHHQDLVFHRHCRRAACENLAGHHTGQADDTGSGHGESLGGFAVGGDQNSDEYKKKHGRSSPQMQPIYFNFDQATIRDDQIIRMEQNAKYLKDNSSTNVIIEGNCDEQGTNEYNLALGERRAMNAQRYLIELGVEDFRIRTISYGEERPLFTGMDEFDYSQNRRDDFVLE